MNPSKLRSLVLAAAVGFAISSYADGNAWMQNFSDPTTVNVTLQAELDMSGSTGSPAIGGVGLNYLWSTVTNEAGIPCGYAQWQYTEPLTVQLQPYTVYGLVLGGNSVYDAELTSIGVNLNPPLTVGASSNSTPGQMYRVYCWSTNKTLNTYNYATQSWQSQTVSGWEPLCAANYPQWNSEADGDGNCDVMEAVTWIQVRPYGSARPLTSSAPQDTTEDTWSRDDAPLDATAAPGDGAKVTISGGKTTNLTDLIINWSATLGRLWTGASAGEIRLVAQNLGGAYDTSGLNYTARSDDTNEIQVLPTNTAPSGIFQQIKAPQTFVVATNLSSTSFQLSFYLPAAMGAMGTNGFYSIKTGSNAFVVWQVATPDGTTNSWRLREIRNSITIDTVLQYTTSTHTWTLTQGTNTQQRIETRQIATNLVSGVFCRTETQQIQNSSGVVTDKTIEGYQQFPWGFELTGVTNDPAGAHLVTTFAYDKASTNDVSYGQMTLAQYPDGYWEQHVYGDTNVERLSDESVLPGQLWRVISPWENSAQGSGIENCLVTQYDYAGEGLDAGVGTYQQVQWHDDAAFGDQDNETNIVCSATPAIVRGGGSFFDEDDCAENETEAEADFDGAPFGTGIPYGRHVKTTYTFGPEDGHLAWLTAAVNRADGTSDAYDFEFGQWNSSTYAFVTSTNAPLDVRQAIYHGSADGEGDEISAGDSGMSFTETILMSPMQSTKELKIIHGGNLVDRETYVYLGGGTNFALMKRVIYQRDCLGHATNVYQIDPLTSATRTIYQANWQGSNPWPLDLKQSQTDQHGEVTTYTYDSLKQVLTKTHQGVSVGGYPSQSAITTSYSYDAAGRVLTNSASAGALSQNTISQFDLDGRLTSRTTSDGLTTTYTYPSGGLVTNVTYSSGATMVISNFLDRRIASITGSAVTNQFLSYSQFDYESADIYMFDGNAFGFEPHSMTTTSLGAASDTRTNAELTDEGGYLAAESRPGFGAGVTLFKDYGMDGFGRPTEINDTGIIEPGLNGGNPTEIGTFLTYESFGKVSTSFDDSDAYADDWSANSLARGATNDWFYEQETDGSWFMVNQTWNYLSDNSGVPTLMNAVKTRMSGFTSGQTAETKAYDVYSNLTDTNVTINFANATVTTAVTVPQSTLTATSVAVNGLLQTGSTPTISNPTWHYYDALGRETSEKDPLGFTTATTYDPVTGQVTSQSDPAGHVTTYYYYPAGGTNAGLHNYDVGPTGLKTYYGYDGCGRLIHKWGDVPYPEELVYDVFGDLVTLHTFRGGSGWTSSTWPSSPGTADTTTWAYDGATGLLTNKTDASGHTVAYSYYNNKLLMSCKWARGASYTNSYDSMNDLVGVAYSDTTPSVTYGNYDRMGSPRLVMDAAGVQTNAYDVLERLTSVTWSNGIYGGINYSGPISGVIVSNHYNTVHGRDSMAALGFTNTLQTTYGWDAYGRVNSVISGTNRVGYSYLANANLLQTTTSSNAAAAVLTTTRQWNYGFQLASIANKTNTNVVTSHAYTYDTLNRRTKATLEDGSFWNYGYNSRNELTGAGRYWSDFTPVTGQQYGYGYDNLGNRASSTFGGDTHGGTLHTVTYAANNLDEYTSISTPGYAEIMGLGLSSNNITVNGGTCDRKGEYFHRDLVLNNTNGPIWTNVSVSNAFAGGTVTNGGLAFAGGSQALTYDADGNLTFDGTWTYAWNAKNQLVTMTMTNISVVPATNRFQLAFAYDCMGRRISKIVSTNSTGSSFVTQSTNYFIYDGWNLIASFNPANVIQQSFVWGLDLAGSFTNAGGIGGLIGVLTNGSSYFVCYDGNGNVTALTPAANGTTAARYEYSPYGELIRASGLLAKGNPFTFSTRFRDGESGLVYYGFRYYYPAQGRWVGRDMLQENGSLNMFLAFNNSPLVYYDANGQCAFLIFPLIGMATGAVGGYLTDGWDGALAGAVGGFVGGLIPNPIVGGMVGGGISSALDNLLNGNFRSHPGAAGCSMAANIVLGGIVGGLGAAVDAGLEQTGTSSTQARGWVAGGLGFGVGAFGGASDRATQAMSDAVDNIASSGSKFDDAQ